MKIFAWMLGIVASVLVFMPLQAAYPYWTAMSAYRSISAQLDRRAVYRPNDPMTEEEVALQRRKKEHWAVREATLKRIEDPALASILLGIGSLILGLVTRKRGGSPVACIGAVLLVNGAAGLCFQEFDWHPLALFAIVGAALVGGGTLLRRVRQRQPAA